MSQAISTSDYQQQVAQLL